MKLHCNILVIQTLIERIMEGLNTVPTAQQQSTFQALLDEAGVPYTVKNGTVVINSAAELRNLFTHENAKGHGNANKLKAVSLGASSFGAEAALTLPAIDCNLKILDMTTQVRRLSNDKMLANDKKLYSDVPIIHYSGARILLSKDGNISIDEGTNLNPTNFWGKLQDWMTNPAQFEEEEKELQKARSESNDNSKTDGDGQNEDTTKEAPVTEKEEDLQHEKETELSPALLAAQQSKFGQLLTRCGIDYSVDKAGYILIANQSDLRNIFKADPKPTLHSMTDRLGNARPALFDAIDHPFKISGVKDTTHRFMTKGACELQKFETGSILQISQGTVTAVSEELVYTGAGSIPGCNFYNKKEPKEYNKGSKIHLIGGKSRLLNQHLQPQQNRTTDTTRCFR